MVSADVLLAEIATAEKRIQQNEEQLHPRDHVVDGHAAAATTTSPLLRLAHLEQESKELLLTQQLTQWAKNQTALYDSDDDDTVATCLKKVMALQELGEIICEQQQQQDDENTEQTATPTPMSLCHQVYQQEFVPHLKYVRAKLLLSLRRELQQAEYPAGCEGLLQEWEEEQERQQQQRYDSNNHEDCSALTRIAQACQGLAHLTRIQRQVAPILWLEPSSSTSSSYYPSPELHNNDVLTELCRPIVERVHFHFLETSPDRPTSTRIDRLPEWLCLYIKEQVWETGVWDVVTHCNVIMHTALLGIKKDEYEHTNDLAIDFVNEIIRLMQFVLEERGYFRHSTIAGPQSKPMLLNNAIQQLMEFDAYLQALVSSSSQEEEPQKQQQRNRQDRIVRLFDACIAGDEELLAWWLERERESIFATLFSEGSVPDSSLPQLISPRAELFCALIRSVRTKAAVFTFSGPYLAQVAAPLCGQFLEAVQESSNDLRQLLLSVVPSSRSSNSSNMRTEDNLRKNCLSWMELINGTHLAATMLSRPLDTTTAQPSSSSGGGDIMGELDLIRFGQSLGQLETVLIEEFARTFVEKLLMERAKLAAYLMRCSYLVGSDIDDKHDEPGLSFELHVTQRLLSVFLDVCSHADDKADDHDDDEEDDDLSLVEVGFAARAMRDCVLNLVTDKLMNVALNADGMTPDLLQPGCTVFYRDVNALFAGSLLPPLALRLLDICKLMSMDRDGLVNIGNALCGLAGQPAPLTEDAFSDDDRLADEALSMMQAKGFVWMQLTDAIVVLNRRRDLS